jgi:N-acetylglutamate synthase-like GNAT family acetyltransferase
MSIRLFKKEDARKVSNLIRKCLIEVVSKSYPKKAIDSLYHFFTPALIIKNSKDRTIFVAVQGNKVIGTASLKADTVFTVFVNPNVHGKGIGSKLMDRVEALAKKKGYTILKVPSATSSYGFYKSRGYKKIKVVHSSTHGDTIEMKKKL